MLDSDVQPQLDNLMNRIARLENVLDQLLAMVGDRYFVSGESYTRGAE